MQCLFEALLVCCGVSYEVNGAREPINGINNKRGARGVVAEAVGLWELWHPARMRDKV